MRKAAPPGWPSALDRFAALHAANSELRVRLRRRQRVLRQLHRNARRAHNARTPAQARRPPTKVGRNGPCPCGSGKEFKHCCGR
ncbi:MAG TPA: SEC-C metal-binding domain-containing protein [Verrucomicrobiota bacterium]|nr:SEC-C metal-binding domain-containing protein [Verrucomicrobiota bacterium]